MFWTFEGKDERYWLLEYSETLYQHLCHDDACYAVLQHGSRTAEASEIVRFHARAALRKDKENGEVRAQINLWDHSWQELWEWAVTDDLLALAAEASPSPEGPL